jgi:hypothetical protein
MSHHQMERAPLHIALPEAVYMKRYFDMYFIIEN